jgi:uncharacterized phage protein gp47/JayE
MPLTVYSFNTLVTNMITAIASQTSKITNFQPGSVALAITQSFAGNSLLIQQLITQMVAITRLGTSTGTDVDSFINDFGRVRLPATPATVQLTLTRSSIGVQLAVPLSTSNIVQTVQGQVQFILVADALQSSYNPVSNSYFFSQAVIQVTAHAVIAGAAGNVGAGTITQVVAGFAGVSSVTNAAPSTSGADAETDAQVRARFPLYLASFKTSNLASVEAAVESIQAGVTYQIIEYQSYNGPGAWITPIPAGVDTLAYFSVIVDDGSGAAPQSFINAVYNAVFATHAAGVRFEIDRPNDAPVNVSLRVIPANGTSLAVIQLAVTAAITAYINGRGVGNSVTLAGIANTVQGVAGVFGYLDILINSASADLVIQPFELARTSGVSYV